MRVKTALRQLIANYNLMAGVGKTEALVEELARFIQNENDAARDQGWAAGEMEANRRSLGR